MYGQFTTLSESGSLSLCQLSLVCVCGVGIQRKMHGHDFGFKQDTIWCCFLCSDGSWDCVTRAKLNALVK